MNTLLILGALLMLLGLFGLVIGGRHSREGYEDDLGFHYGQKTPQETD